MSDIPEDVMVTARVALDRVWTYPDGTYPCDSYEIIASAILAERKRCASIAWHYGGGVPDGYAVAKAIETDR